MQSELLRSREEKLNDIINGLMGWTGARLKNKNLVLEGLNSLLISLETKRNKYA